MIVGAYTVVRRYSDALRRRGTPIVWRRVSRLAGGDAQPNPPTLLNPVLDGNVSAGATSLSIRATAASGRLFPGDALALGSLPPLVVAAITPSRAIGSGTPGFTAVPLTSAIPSAQPDGTPIVPTWAADSQVYARIGGFPLQVIGDQILSNDLSVEMAAFGLSAVPSPIDLLVIDGNVRTIVAMVPTYALGAVVKWTIQAR